MGAIIGQGLGGLASQTVMVLVSQANCLSASAPLFYVSASQINFQVPWELCASGTSVTLVAVSVNGLVSDTENGGLVLAPFAPGIFTLNASGNGLGAILIASTGELAAPGGIIPGRASRPAKPREYISIYCTGLGPVTNQPATGMQAAASPLSQTTTAPTVTIGGAAALVTFAGLAPSYIGLYQVNAQVPVNTPAGDAVPVSLSIGGAASNMVTMAIASQLRIPAM